MEKQLVIRNLLSITIAFACACGLVNAADKNGKADLDPNSIKGLTGQISNLQISLPAATDIKLLKESQLPDDINFKRMAQWAMNYLINTPRKEFNYEPVFQCHPLKCPPVPKGHDPVVACDTESRMDWEWYYMRDISGSDAGRDIEEAFHKRLRSYMDANGLLWNHPGAYHEGNINAKYTKEDYVLHTWGTVKILKSLTEDYLRTKNPESRKMARKVMLGLKKIAVWDDKGRCWFKQGMGTLKADGSVVPNHWNVHPAPVIDPLVTYYLATLDTEALDFAQAYARGIMENCQPGGIRFDKNGVPSGGFKWGPHSHATMHAVWGVTHLGVVTGEREYIDFSKGAFSWLLARGTGTGWFPAGPDSCCETCCISDMISTASLIARAGSTEYYDYVERYMRNYISNLQFIITPEFEAYYRSLNKDKNAEEIEKGLSELQKYQGGIIGGSGLNDYENVLLGGLAGFEMFGCCAPEGMRAIYTTWSNIIEQRPASKLGPKGVYVNLCLSRRSKWGKVVSFFPKQGRITVVPSVNDTFFLRPPHWAPKEKVRAFAGTKSVPVKWSGAYIQFEAEAGQELTITYPLISFTHKVQGLWKNSAPDLKVQFEWLGNMVISSTPHGGHTPLFTGKPRVLPEYKNYDD